jgi:hypothetical protein
VGCARPDAKQCLLHLAFERQLGATLQLLGSEINRLSSRANRLDDRRARNASGIKRRTSLSRNCSRFAISMVDVVMEASLAEPSIARHCLEQCRIGSRRPRSLRLQSRVASRITFAIRWKDGSL